MIKWSASSFDRLNSSTNSDDVRYFAKYWTSSAEGLPAPTLSIVSESRSHPTVGTSANEIYDFIPMRPSLRVGTLGEASALDDNVGRSSVQPPLLFNLNEDVSEKYNIAEDYPEIIDKIKYMIENHRRNLNAPPDLLSKRTSKEF